MPARPNAAELEEFLTRAVAEVVVRDDLAALLRSGERRLRVKQGFDPTRPNLHLGHAVSLRKLRKLAEWGHEIVLIIGDYTTQIGDPTDKDETRPMIPHEEILENARTYQDQFHRIVPRENTRVAFQTEWYRDFSLKDLFTLASRFTVQQMLAREEFRKRQAAGTPIPVKDLLYPLLQAYDSVAIEADVEFGGTDQLFNILGGRELQQRMGQRPQHAFIVQLLEGTDGEKMSKTKPATGIWLVDPPEEIYGKVMSIDDGLMPHYFEWGTEMPLAEVRATLEALERGDLHPREAKKTLARQIVKELHSESAAEAAAATFEERMRSRSRPLVAVGDDGGYHGVQREITGVAGDTLPITQVLVMFGFVRNNAEAKRLIADGVVRLNSDPVNISTQFKRGMTGRLHVGRRFADISW